MKFLDLLFPQKRRPTMQESIDKCLAAGIEPHKINSAMMAIALDEIESLKDINADLLESLERLIMTTQIANQSFEVHGKDLLITENQMTQNELVDELGITLEELCESQRETIRHFREVMRKQSADIKALKKQLEASALLNYNKGHEDGRKLATSPVKELTDEEITEVAEEVALNHFRSIKFARAILKKGW